jgi:hypothetical protein
LFFVIFLIFPARVIVIVVSGLRDHLEQAPVGKRQ